jgi:hypothetical protein
MEEMIEKIVKRALEDSYFLQDMKKEILDEINEIYKIVDDVNCNVKNVESITSNLDR